MSSPKDFDFDEDRTDQLKIEKDRCSYLTAMAAMGDRGWIDSWLCKYNFLDSDGFKILKEYVLERKHFNN